MSTSPRRVLGKIVAVPDSWEGWAMRVMTICMALLLVVTVWLSTVVIGLADYQRESRSQRLHFQQMQQERECLMLAEHDTPADTLTVMGC